MPGCVVEAIRPPTTPPNPIPRFIVIRWTENTEGRCQRSVSAASSVDWDGQKPPLPMPATAAATNPSQAVSTKAKLAKPSASSNSAMRSTRRGPKRSTTGPHAGPATSDTAELVPTINPERPSEIPRTLCR